MFKKKINLFKLYKNVFSLICYITNSMFYNCKSLKSFPDISKWNISKIAKKDSMFAGVDENIIPQIFK